MQDSLPLVKDGCPVGAGVQCILVKINNIYMPALDRKTDVQEMTDKRSRPTDGFKRGDRLADHNHAALESVVSRATVENVITWEAPRAGKPPMGLLK